MISAFKQLNVLVLAKLESFVRLWLPGGQLQGNEYVVKNPMRADQSPGSFKININTGRWSDFATGDSGGDPVSLYAYLNCLTQGDAAKILSKQMVKMGTTDKKTN